MTPSELAQAADNLSRAMSRRAEALQRYNKKKYEMEQALAEVMDAEVDAKRFLAVLNVNQSSLNTLGEGGE